MFWLVQNVWFLHGANRADGVIVVDAPHPSVRFVDTTGQTLQFVQNGFVSRSLGSAVEVAYERRDPAGTARVVTFWTTWGSALWLLPFALAALFGTWSGPTRPWLRLSWPFSPR